MVETIPSWSSLKFQPSTLHVPATFFFSAHLWCFQLSVRFQKECTRLPYVFFNVFIRSIFLLCVCELCCVFCLPNGVVVVAGNIFPFSWIKWFSSSLKVIVLFFSSKRWFVLSKKIKHAPDSDPFLYISSLRKVFSSLSNYFMYSLLSAYWRFSCSFSGTFLKLKKYSFLLLMPLSSDFVMQFFLKISSLFMLTTALNHFKNKLLIYEWELQ